MAPPGAATADAGWPARTAAPLAAPLPRPLARR